MRIARQKGYEQGGTDAEIRLRFILSHKVFADTLKKFFDCGVMPCKNDIVDMMKKSDLHNIESNETFERRSSTIRGWINWIVGLINE